MSPLYELAKEGVDLRPSSGRPTRGRARWRTAIRWSTLQQPAQRRVSAGDAGVGTGLSARECGDVMKLQIKVNLEPCHRRTPKFKTFGCGARSPLRAWPRVVKGKTIDEAAKIQEHRHRERAEAAARWRSTARCWRRTRSRRARDYKESAHRCRAPPHPNRGRTPRHGGCVVGSGGEAGEGAQAARRPAGDGFLENGRRGGGCSGMSYC